MAHSIFEPGLIIYAIQIAESYHAEKKPPRRPHADVMTERVPVKLSLQTIPVQPADTGVRKFPDHSSLSCQPHPDIRDFHGKVSIIIEQIKFYSVFYEFLTHRIYKKNLMIVDTVVDFKECTM